MLHVRSWLLPIPKSCEVSDERQLQEQEMLLHRVNAVDKMNFGRKCLIGKSATKEKETGPRLRRKGRGESTGRKRTRWKSGAFLLPLPTSIGRTLTPSSQGTLLPDPIWASQAYTFRSCLWFRGHFRLSGGSNARPKWEVHWCVTHSVCQSLVMMMALSSLGGGQVQSRMMFVLMGRGVKRMERSLASAQEWHTNGVPRSCHLQCIFASCSLRCLPLFVVLASWPWVRRLSALPDQRHQTSYYSMILSVTNPAENKQGAHIKHATLRQSLCPLAGDLLMVRRPGSVWVSLRLVIALLSISFILNGWTLPNLGAYHLQHRSTRWLASLSHLHTFPDSLSQTSSGSLFFPGDVSHCLCTAASFPAGSGARLAHSCGPSSCPPMSSHSLQAIYSPTLTQ